MPRRYPLPKLWLMTDERQGEALWRALKRLPRGSGVIIRHYSLSPAERRRLIESIRTLARVRRLVLILADAPEKPIEPRKVDGAYGTRTSHPGFNLAPAHNLREIRRAERDGADLLLLSPLFATRSHPEASALGPARFAGLAHATRLPVVALGGVNARRHDLVKRIGAYGWAGIDAFIGAGASQFRT